MLNLVPPIQRDAFEEARVLLRFAEAWRPALRIGHLWYAVAPLLCAVLAGALTRSPLAVGAVLLGSALSVPLVRAVTGPRRRWSPRER